MSNETFDLVDIPRPARALVVGASGGIGAALATRLEVAQLAVTRASRGGDEGLRLDVTDETSIAAACAELRKGAPLRIVVVASGLLHDRHLQPEKNLREVDPAALARIFAVNSIGPLLIAKHTLPLIPRKGRSVMAMLSARVGSISDNRLGGWYSYRASKAALNQLVRTMAIEAARTHPDLVVAALHPGTVGTKLSAPLQRGRETVGPNEAALIQVLDGLSPAETGGFFAWDGSAIAY